MSRKRHALGVIILLAGAAGIQSSESQPEALPGEALARKVTIRRDSYGIPHILAESEEAAALGFGYAQAEDHCLEIARSLVSARGEEAKHFGTGAESDFALRLYDITGCARKDLRQVSSLYRKMVNAYAAGINRYVARHRDELPPWVPVFTGEDVMASRRAGAIRSAFSRRTTQMLERKYADAGAPPAGPPPERFQLPADAGTDGVSAADAPGSNALALAGSRTVSGHPILLGNPHLNWSSLYWEAQVTVPGKIDFFGSTLAGIPVLRAGFNQHLGWVTTNNAPDVIDIFALVLDPKKPDHYLFRGRSRPLTRRVVSVEIRQDDGGLRTETRTYWDSHLGKILYRTADRAFAVQSSQLDAVHYYEGFYSLSKTRSLRQFLSAMDRNMVPTSNFTYADAAGNIMYLWNARIPQRREDGTDFSLDVPAADDRYAWKRMLPVSRFPRLINPGGGSIQNCNNPPWYASLEDPIDPRLYPGYLEAERELALRPQIALELLGEKDRFSVEDVIRLKYNTRMLLADRVKPDLLDAIRRAGESSEELRRGREVLEAWDNRVAAASRGAVLFQRFWDTYSRATEKPFGVFWDLARPASTPRGLSDPALAVRHLADAVRWTREKYGSEEVAWGDVHRFRFGELDLPADGASGSYGLFRVLTFPEGPDGRRVAGQVEPDAAPVGFGDAWILLVEFSRPIRAQSVLAYGQTTRSASSHSSDQIRLFAAHQLRPVWFTEAEIRANLQREYRP